jgi:beta-fructofuranosidase
MTIEKALKYIKENKHKVNEEFRMKFHAMPEIGWMNDPNGLAFFKGQYHIFYQHYPYNSVWGSMHWGHIISNDMVKYEYAPIALAPDQSDESGCYSGGAIIRDEKLHLFYTKHLEKDGKIIETQGLAISEDGIFFNKVNKPIIDSELLGDNALISDTRDPVPYYHNGKYYLIIGTKDRNDKGKFIICESEDLKTYKYHDTIEHENLFGNMAECPDLIDFDDANVLLYSKISYNKTLEKNENFSQYIIGDFNFENKTYDFHKCRDIDSGYHFYAPQTLKDDKDRIIMIAWMEMWGRQSVTHELGHNWQGSCTFPRVLTLKDNILYQWPIEEITNYYGALQKITNHQIFPKQADLFIDQTEESFSLKFCNMMTENEYFEVGFDGEKVYIDGSNLTRDAFGKKCSQYEYESVSLRILVDTSSFEIFVNNGKEAFTARVYINRNNYILSSYGSVSGHFYHIDLEEL